ncbi:basic proline-rich protein-like [Corapipo altera]|uniref:basic proline-rich protein-like n=1 Tax=Corapipo altera TaxID=415028 RepID=UPI000FD695D7|nr:basic proline-rich protein-like [Corapipo altera]
MPQLGAESCAALSQSHAHCGAAAAGNRRAGAGGCRGPRGAGGCRRQTPAIAGPSPDNRSCLRQSWTHREPRGRTVPGGAGDARRDPTRPPTALRPPARVWDGTGTPWGPNGDGFPSGMKWGVTAPGEPYVSPPAAPRLPHTPAHVRARGRTLARGENRDTPAEPLTPSAEPRPRQAPACPDPGAGTRWPGHSVPPSPSPPSQTSQTPSKPPAQRRARPGVMTGQPGPAAPSDPLPPRRRAMDAPRAGSLRPGRFAAGRGERDCCRAPGQAGDAYRCILIVRPRADNHGPGLCPCPSRGAAGAHAEVVRARSHGAAPGPLCPNKREQSEAGRVCQRRGGRATAAAEGGTDSGHREPGGASVPARQHRGAGANWAAATGGFYFGSRPGGFSSDKHARGVADSPVGAERRAEPPRGCRGPGSEHSGPGAIRGGHSPLSPPRGPPSATSPHPKQSIPAPQPALRWAQVGLPGAGSPQPRTGSIPSPAPAPSPAPHRLHPQHPSLSPGGSARPDEANRPLTHRELSAPDGDACAVPVPGTRAACRPGPPRQHPGSVTHISTGGTGTARPAAARAPQEPPDRGSPGDAQAPLMPGTGGNARAAAARCRDYSSRPAGAVPGPRRTGAASCRARGPAGAAAGLQERPSLSQARPRRHRPRGTTRPRRSAPAPPLSPGPVPGPVAAAPSSAAPDRPPKPPAAASSPEAPRPPGLASQAVFSARPRRSIPGGPAAPPAGAGGRCGDAGDGDGAARSLPSPWTVPPHSPLGRGRRRSAPPVSLPPLRDRDRDRAGIARTHRACAAPPGGRGRPIDHAHAAMATDVTTPS